MCLLSGDRSRHLRRAMRFHGGNRRSGAGRRFRAGHGEGNSRIVVCRFLAEHIPNSFLKEILDFLDADGPIGILVQDQGPDFRAETRGQGGPVRGPIGCGMGKDAGQEPDR